MTDVLVITGPIYLVILAGYVAVRSGRVSIEQVRGLGLFAVNFALPAMVFTAVAAQPIRAVLNWTYVVSYAAGSLAAGAMTFIVARRFARDDVTGAACQALGASCSNSAFIGFPILLLAAPEVAGVAFALNTIVENLLVMPLLLFLAERGRAARGTAGRETWNSLTQLVRRPLMIGLFAGLIASLVQPELPVVVSRTITLFAQASSALTLFFVGGTLGAVPLGRVLTSAAPIVAGKLLLHPLCVALAIAATAAIGLAPLEPRLRTAALLMAAVPMMAMYPVLVHRYGREQLAAAALLLATAVSFVTLNVAIWLLGAHAG